MSIIRNIFVLISGTKSTEFSHLFLIFYYTRANYIHTRRVYIQDDDFSNNTQPSGFDWIDINKTITIFGPEMFFHSFEGKKYIIDFVFILICH